MNIKSIDSVMYFLVKDASRDSWTEFLENCGCTEEEWQEFKDELEKIGITKTYQ
jgi:hypothetical protein